MAKVKIIYDEQALTDLVSKNKYIRDEMVGVARKVASEAQATASEAENGPGGRLDGYADSGFSVEYESRGGKRPRVNIKSNAPGDVALAVHFNSQRKTGVGHLRAALYKFTQRG